MPYIGLIPFLHRHEIAEKVKGLRFNALHRAYPISTTKTFNSNLIAYGFQCPTSGLSHFYENFEVVEAEKVTEFQCPTSGLSHFYMTYNFNDNVYSLVSMPYIGLIPFLPYIKEVNMTIKFCFNALHRAYPISTYNGFVQLLVPLRSFNALHRAYPISTLDLGKPL